MSHLECVISFIAELSPMQGRFVGHSVSLINSEDKAELASLVDFYSGQGISDQNIAKSYLTIVEDTLAEQIYFRKNKKYRYSTFNEVKDSVYFSDSYMSNYMVGLALTLYLWPNHHSILKFFASTLPQGVKGKYLEIGPGHGVFFKKALETCSYDHFTALDISKKSLELTKQILNTRAQKLLSNAEFVCQDFLNWDTKEVFDAVVMGEVLEHVEKPEQFLSKIKEITKPQSHIYITTCVNAPAIEHIYLFTDVEQVRSLLTSTGLKVQKELILPYENHSLEEGVRRKLPINVAYVLNHA